MNYTAKVFLRGNWMIKLITIVLIAVIIGALALGISAGALFVSTLLNFPGLVVLALLASISFILIAVTTKGGKINE